MENYEVNNYLSYEHASQSPGSQITRIGLSNGDTLITKFLNRDQKPDLMAQNKWVIWNINALSVEVIEGNDIVSLNVGEKLFN